MKAEHQIFYVQTFLIDHADSLDIHKEDIKKWIVVQHDGLMPDHNLYYEVYNSVLSFLDGTRRNLYRLNHIKAEQFLQSYPDKLKQFKEKKKVK